ncbi:hypothetical protein PLESTB_000865100 [Pleodorina starrii]|uniref:Probable magnesium transporter n=1 Tax=Pleodorina starrii TaxID=330485 RepID=A0A9W6BLN5_9CHLO|nr:hypothetical protein PLESTM_001428800 [Pleodorina starrii]GLC54452.1 hypothetical protein PLESTB_000865100 [Pleodorina starrii]GLC72107.1 hypothetical protein PLESTF_001204500 [Pleodorina starrii]
MSSPLPPPPMVEEETTRDLWYVGAIINVVGSIAINLGTNLMKLGHNKRAKVDCPEAQKPPVRKIKEWVIGMSFFSVGNILNFVSFGFAAQSLLAALGSIQFVSNVVFAYFVLHEPINRMILIATACIVGGCILLVVFGNQSSATYTVKQLTELYTKPAYVVYLCLMGVGVVGGYLLYLHGQKMVNKNGPKGIWYALLPVAYSVFSALIGTQSVLFSKSMSVILRLTFTGDNQLGNWYTWLVLPLFLVTAVFWITRLNKGLRMFPAMIIVPVMQISWTLFSIVSGMLYFQEYLGFNVLKSIMFPIGVLVVFVGVFLLTQSGATKQASYQKMEEVAAAKAAKQDAALKAFGSRDAVDFDLPVRAASLDSIRSESTVVAVDAGPPAGAVGPASLDEAARPSPTTPRESSLGLTISGGSDAPRLLQPASPVNSQSLDDTTAKPSDATSMMGKVKVRLRNVQERLNKDLLGVEARAGFRLAMGLGDSGMPAISLFAMPTMIDYARADTSTGPHSDVSVTSPKEGEPMTAGLSPIVEESDKAAGGSPQPAGVRAASEEPRGPAEGASPAARPPTAPGSPRLAQAGPSRSLIDKAIDKAERAAKTSIEAIKRAPSNLQRAVREKQGYGSLTEDEETGLLELMEASDGAAASTKRR